MSRDYKPMVRYGSVIIAIIVTMIIALHAEGRILYCSCGYIKLWHGAVISSENSQHILDWYSFTHVLHGFAFYFLIWLADRKKKLSIGAKLVIAVGLAASWELLENSPFIIDRYRTATISLDYYGDSIINSLGDLVSMAIGFSIAYRSRIYVSIALFVAIELLLAYYIRDNLTINIIMLIHPIEALKVWQMGG